LSIDVIISTHLIETYRFTLQVGHEVRLILDFSAPLAIQLKNRLIIPELLDLSRKPFCWDVDDSVVD
jgi:hypothetical protein